jgi:cytochrome d ubiquinol oxidase subunit II
VWLQLRTEDPIASRARSVVRLAAIAVIVLFALGGVWLSLGVDGYRIVSMADPGALPDPLGKVVEPAAGAWLANYSAYPLAMLAPALGFLGAVLTLLLSGVGRAGWAFVTSSIALTGIILTAGVSLFPFIMPSSSDPRSSLTVWDAPSSHLTLTVMFWAVVVFLPIILGYTVWTYRRMWGKVTVQEIQLRAHSAY